MKIAAFIFSVLLMIWSCSNAKSDTTSPNAINTNIAPDSQIDLTEFYEFYNRFHSDTAYQMAHISFPLAGKPTQGIPLPEGEKFYWQAENWQPHRPIDFETSPFNRRILPFGDDLVVEYIVHEKMGFGMMRRFAKLGNEWYLIYYEGMEAVFGEE